MTEPRDGVCAWCQYFKPNAPTGWKRDPDFPSPPTLRDWKNNCREVHGSLAILEWETVPGHCAVAPVRVDVRGDHGCKQYVDKSIPDPTDMLARFCEETWAQRRLNWALKDIELLKRKLTFNRNLARKRLVKIRTLEQSGTRAKPQG